MGEELQAGEMACIKVQMEIGLANSKKSRSPAVNGEEWVGGERSEMSIARKTEVSPV